MRIPVFLFAFLLLLFSCNTIKNPLMGKRSPHEKYGDAIIKSGLEKSALGKVWFEAATKALSYPQQITLPYKETGFFSSDKPFATGFLFKSLRGERVVATLSSNPDTVVIFLELWRKGITSASLLATTDTTSKSLTYTVSENDLLMIRIQPELLADVEYTLTITTRPSLAFPVVEDANPRIISFWGSGRDNNTRKHEGVDIGAKFRAPAVAAADGIVSRVNENNLGGKVVFLRDIDTGNNLYYAHLDSQIAVEGQKIKAGDTIGLIGNTGNARNTAPHLHFGIYSSGGAVDPLPFINAEVRTPKEITASTEPIYQFLRTATSTSLYKETATQSAPVQSLKKNEPVFILAATGNWYRVKLPDNITGYIESHSLIAGYVFDLSIKQATELKMQPLINSPVKNLIKAGEEVKVLGIHDGFYLVDHEGKIGWMNKPV